MISTISTWPDFRGNEYVCGMEKFLKEQLAGDSGQDVIDLCLDHSLVGEFLDQPFQGISGLDLFPNLEELSISKHTLRSMRGLENLPSLKRLDLSINELEEVEIEGILPALQYLDLSHNEIEVLKELAIHGQLEEINLGHNALSSMRMEGQLPSLKVLNLSGNRRIKKIEGLKNYPGLHSLYLRGCYVVDWEGLGEGQSLEELSLTPANLFAISPLSALEKLRWLLVGGSRVQPRQVVPEMKQLKHLQFANTGLELLEGLENVQKLETLVLRKNRLQNPPDLSGTPELRYLDMSFNPLHSLPDLSVVPELKTLVLEGTPIHPRALVDLQEMYPSLEVRF